MFLDISIKRKPNGKLSSKVVKPIILPVNSIKSYILYKCSWIFVRKRKPNGRLFSKVVKPILPVNSIKSHILYKHVLDALI